MAGIDYQETFAPVARIDTIRLITAIAATCKWKLYHFDVKSTFLNGKLNEEIYIEQPLGFEIESDKGKVYRLHKALHGVKASSTSLVQ